MRLYLIKQKSLTLHLDIICTRATKCVKDNNLYEPTQTWILKIVNYTIHTHTCIHVHIRILLYTQQIFNILIHERTRFIIFIYSIIIYPSSVSLLYKIIIIYNIIKVGNISFIYIPCFFLPYSLSSRVRPWYYSGMIIIIVIC